MGQPSSPQNKTKDITVIQDATKRGYLHDNISEINGARRSSSVRVPFALASKIIKITLGKNDRKLRVREVFRSANWKRRLSRIVWYESVSEVWPGFRTPASDTYVVNSREFQDRGALRCVKVLRHVILYARARLYASITRKCYVASSVKCQAR